MGVPLSKLSGKDQDGKEDIVPTTTAPQAAAEAIVNMVPKAATEATKKVEDEGASTTATPVPQAAANKANMNMEEERAVVVTEAANEAKKNVEDEGATTVIASLAKAGRN